MKPRIKIPHFLSPFKITGGIIMFFSFFIFVYQAFMSSHNYMIFLYAFFFGLILFTISRGIELDSKKEEFRVYLTICGVRFGFWQKKEGYRIVIERNTNSTSKRWGEMYSHGRVEEFHLQLIGKNNISLQKFNDYKEAIGFSKKVSIFLEFPI